MVSVSIIIPVYKVEKYIEECIRSVMSQTYEGDMECIIVDDCGGDDSIAICERLISEYTGPIKFTILHHEHNRGLSAARNTGIDAATGDYLYFIDSDDYIYPDSIKILAELANKYPGVNLVQGNCESEATIIPNINKLKTPEYIDHPLQVDAILFNGIQVTSWNKLILTKLVKENHLYFPEGLIHEDEYWRLAYHHKIRSLAYTLLPTYYYRIHENSIMGNIDLAKLHKNFIKIINIVFSREEFNDSLMSTNSIFLDKLKICKISNDDDYNKLRKEFLRQTYRNPHAPIKIKTISWLLHNNIISPKNINKFIYLLYPFSWHYYKKHNLGI